MLKMIDINLNKTVNTPLYQQIAEQVRQLVANNRLQPGERLPAIRQLASSLHVNPGTVLRAYLDLEQEKIVVSRRGGGTVVAAAADDPNLKAMRENRLSSLVSNGIVDVLSLGYSPDELEAAFLLHLTRWREERRIRTDSPESEGSKADDENTILIVGSHDLALNILVSQLKERNPGLRIEVTSAGSLGGLIALQEGKAHLAGIHLLDEETGEYNYPYIRHILPGREMVICHLAYRLQGLLLARDNPRQIEGLQDLKRQDITFINRQSGSGTRILLDMELRKQGITPHNVRGYGRELNTHMEVAVNIARGEADCGLGIEAAARACNLDFIPLFKERYDLVIPEERYESALLSPFLKIINSIEFRNVVNRVGGYDTSQMGATTLCR